MASIWTPGGERPVRTTPPAQSPADPDPRRDAAYEAPSGADPGFSEAGSPADEAEMRAVLEQLAQAPATTVIENHCFGLFELAAVHLGQQPPNLGEASLAIDALGAIVDALKGRLGEHEPQLHDAVASLRLAFVQIKTASAGAPSSAAGGAPNGAS